MGDNLHIRKLTKFKFRANIDEINVNHTMLNSLQLNICKSQDFCVYLSVIKYDPNAEDFLIEMGKQVAMFPSVPGSYKYIKKDDIVIDDMPSVRNNRDIDVELGLNNENYRKRKPSFEEYMDISKIADFEDMTYYDKDIIKKKIEFMTPTLDIQSHYIVQFSRVNIPSFADDPYHLYEQIIPYLSKKSPIVQITIGDFQYQYDTLELALIVEETSFTVFEAVIALVNVEAYTYLTKIKDAINAKIVKGQIYFGFLSFIEASISVDNTVYEYDYNTFRVFMKQWMDDHEQFVVDIGDSYAEVNSIYTEMHKFVTNFGKLCMYENVDINKSTFLEVLNQRRSGN